YPAGQRKVLWPELKRLFDYYLSAVGEQTIDAIAQQIRLELQQRLPKTQHEAAQKLLTQYLAFKKALVAVELEQTTQGTGIAAIRLRFTAMQNLRAQYFSAQEELAMFGPEDAQDRDALARLEVSEDPKLSAAQKRERLAAIDAAMPAALRAEREALRIVINVENRAAEMRAAGASDDDIFRMRAKAFDTQAASRLAELDKEEAAWAARIATYQQARVQLLKKLADSPVSERDAALAELQQAQFSAQERPRLAAYEN
ncbi:MAG: lipase secretion chaperone, partial [Rhodoferax sp.]